MWKKDLISLLLVVLQSKDENNFSLRTKPTPGENINAQKRIKKRVPRYVLFILLKGLSTQGGGPSITVP